MTTDNRANEPTEAMVEAAAKEIYGDDPAWGYVNDYGDGEVAAQWGHLGTRVQEMFRLKARAALEAADVVVAERELELLAHEHAREEYGVGLRAVDQRVAFEQGALFALALFRGGVK